MPCKRLKKWLAHTIWMIIPFMCGALIGIRVSTNAGALSKNDCSNLMFIDFKDVMADVTGASPGYPKYVTQLINLANQNAQATRPRYVGQMSELIKQCPERTYKGWTKWYIKKYPGAIDRATDKTYAMIEKMRAAMDKIDRQLVKRWIAELILAKTYAGLRFQESILKHVSAELKTDYTRSTPGLEARGIDGYIGTRPVSIKPVTYLSKQPMTSERIDVPIIYYEKIRGGIRVCYDQVVTAGW